MMVASLFSVLCAALGGQVFEADERRIKARPLLTKVCDDLPKIHYSLLGCTTRLLKTQENRVPAYVFSAQLICSYLRGNGSPQMGGHASSIRVNVLCLVLMYKS